MTTTVAKIQQLVEEIAGRLAGHAWIVAVSRCSPLIPVTDGAGLHALLYGVERRRGRGGGVGAAECEHRR
jgi:hypothetical protein